MTNLIWELRGYSCILWSVHWTLVCEVCVQDLARSTVLCSLAKHYTLTVPLSIHEYKWVLANRQGSLVKYGKVTL